MPSGATPSCFNLPGINELLNWDVMLGCDAGRAAAAWSTPLQRISPKFILSPSSQLPQHVQQLVHFVMPLFIAMATAKT